MGEEAWEEGWRKGRAMTLDEVDSYALAGEEEASGRSLFPSLRTSEKRCS
jgi:hypothetical protein